MALSTEDRGEEAVGSSACTKSEAALRQERNVCGYDAPAFIETHPDLALAASDNLFWGVAFELQGDAAEVAPEADDVEARDSTGKIGARTPHAKSLKLSGPVEILCHAKAHHLCAGPEHPHQRVHVVRDQRLFVARIQRAKFKLSCASLTTR